MIIPIRLAIGGVFFGIFVSHSQNGVCFTRAGGHGKEEEEELLGGILAL
jgi:hypothetical protein